MLNMLLVQSGLPDQVGRRRPLVKAGVAVSEKDVPCRFGTMPSFAVRRVGKNAASEDDGLRNIGQTVH